MSGTKNSTQINKSPSVFVETENGAILAQSKSCTFCQRLLPLEDFYYKKTEGRHDSRCRSCVVSKKVKDKKEKREMVKKEKKAEENKLTKKSGAIVFTIDQIEICLTPFNNQEEREALSRNIRSII